MPMSEPATQKTTTTTESGETYDRLSLMVIALVVAIAGIWAVAIAVFGFAAFIYPLLTTVALAFVFVLTLTRA